MDETCVRLVPEEGRGHVSKKAYRLFVEGKPMGRRATLGQRRSNITHVAAICDKPSFQRLLPQVILLGEKQVSEDQVRAYRLSSPECAHIWRCKTAWMTSVIMTKYVRLLGRSLKEFKASHRFILFVDVHRAHVSPAALRAASAVGLWVCVVPGKLTYALQPCDTHLFATYKRVLMEEVQRMSGLSANGEVNWNIVLRAVWHVVVHVMHSKDWSRAFSSVGIANEQRSVSARTSRKLQMTATSLEVGRRVPTLSDLIHVFPKGANIPIHELFFQWNVSAGGYLPKTVM